MFEIPVRYPSGYVGKAVGYTSLKLREEVRPKDIDL